MNTDLPPGTLLLDYIRYHRHLSGTKIGCREGDCGACTVLVGEMKSAVLVYSSVTSCLMPLINAAGKHIVTIEGLNGQGLNPIQQAMADESATQCGFCTPGFVVSLAGFCLSNTERGKEAAIASVNGNICRCTGYKSIERAAEKVAALMDQKEHQTALAFATDSRILPAYFTTIEGRLASLQTNGQLPQTGKPFLGGGTDLYVQQPEAMVHTGAIPLVSKKELSGIWQQGGRCYVGAASTVSDILASPIFQAHFPTLKKFIKLVSSTPIRNMATVGGNLVNASPIGDLTIFFLALDADVVLSNGEEERIVGLRNFYTGYKQLNKQQNEFMARLSFVLPNQHTQVNFEKVCKRTHLDIASVNTALLMDVVDGVITTTHLSAGGVGPCPLYLKKAVEFLREKTLSEETVRGAIAVAQTEISPISDVRGSAEYKRLLLSQLIKAHFLVMYPWMNADLLLEP